MSNRHPIIPPPDLVEEWFNNSPIDRGLTLATQAAQWGADQELEACVEWLGDAPVVWSNNKAMHPGSFLRNARRPKPPSLKEQALEQLDGIATCFRVTHMGDIVCDKIRKALEALPND